MTKNLFKFNKIQTRIKNMPRFEKILNILSLIAIIVISFSIINSTISDIKQLTIDNNWKLININNFSEINNSLEKRDFFNSNWGDSIDKVLEDNAQFELERLNEDFFYRKNFRFLNFNTYTVFYFEDNKLLVGGIMFDESIYNNSNEIIENYNKVKNILIQEFGEPIEETELWTSDDYKNYPEKHDEAIVLGHLKYHALWKTDTSDIELLSGNKNVEMFLSYAQKN